MLIFNVSHHISRGKQAFETLEKRIFIQTKLDHFENTLSMSFYPFSEKKIVINIQLKPILEVFPICCFTICEKTQKQFG